MTRQVRRANNVRSSLRSGVSMTMAAVTILLPHPLFAGGMFTSTGNMTTARAGHMATLLLDGRVLVTGGIDNDRRPLASAELYDPSTSTFTATGNMTEPRGGHSATLLLDGTVLIIAHTAEIYDPSTGTFTATGSMISGFGFLATLLQDGRVFVAENYNAEIYDPTSGTFALTGPYSRSTTMASATSLLDGRVLVTGDNESGGESNELYDPNTDTFSSLGPRRYWIDSVSKATLLIDGTVLFVESNFDGFPAPSGAQLFDPATGTFTQIGLVNEWHVGCAAVSLLDGTALITGGQLPGAGNGNHATELYLPETRTFSEGYMIMGRYSHTATLISDGTVLIAGGISSWFPYQQTSSAEIFTPGAH